MHVDIRSRGVWKYLPSGKLAGRANRSPTRQSAWIGEPRGVWVGQQDLDAQPGTWAQGVHQASGSLKESRPYSEKQWAIGGLWMTGGYTSSHSGGDHDGRDYDYEHEERR